MIKIRLLGGFQIAGPTGEEITVSARKSKALFIWLLMHPNMQHSRDRLAGMLWEESSDSQARHSLRQALSSLRRTLPDAESHLQGDTESLRLDPSQISIDVNEFKRHVGSDQPDELKQALAIYQGDFLEGFNPRSMAFEDWMLQQRSECRELALKGLEKLLGHYRQSGELESAVRAGHQLLALDSLRESVHRELMSIYVQMGREAQALKQYRTCRSLLQRELGVAVTAETQSLYRSILSARQQPRKDASPQALPEAEQGVETVQPAVQPPVSAKAAVRQPQRRQLAVLAIKQANWQQWQSELDPETAWERMDQAESQVQELVERFGGSILTRHGGVTIAAFGIDRLRGNEATRALYCAQALRQAETANANSSGSASDLRMAVSFGPVLFQAGSSLAESRVAGEAVLLAERMIGLASQGQILMSDSLWHQLPNIDAEPVPGFQPDSQLTGCWQFEGFKPSAPEGELPLVGRQMEMAQFGVALERCIEDGYGQVFLLRGEAGIGKSRLLQAFREQADNAGFTCLYRTLLGLELDSDRQTVRELISDLIGVLSESPEADEQSRLQSLTDRVGLSQEERLMLKDLLLMASEATQSLLQSMDDSARSLRRKQVIAKLLQPESLGNPLVVFIEDLHWAQGFALEVIAKLAQLTLSQPLLLVLSSRLDGEPFNPGWRSQTEGAAITTLDLPPLRANEARKLADQVGGPGDELTELCIQRAEGNPFYLQQLMLHQSQREQVPDSIQGLVAARMDRLAEPDSSAIKMAAVLGQRFELKQLQMMVGQGEYTAQTLVDQRFLRIDNSQCQFTHALIVESVYASLLASERKRWHQAAADLFESDPLRRVEHLLKAEAEGAGGTAFAVAEECFASYRLEETLRLVDQALALKGDSDLKFQLLILRGTVRRLRGQIETAVTVFNQALELAQTPPQRKQAWCELAECQNMINQHETALESLAAASNESVEDNRTELQARMEYLRGNALFILGRLGDCLQAQQSALQAAESSGSVRYQAKALSGIADAYYQRGQMETASRYFDQCLKLAGEAQLFDVQAANLPMRAACYFYQMQVQQGLQACNDAVRIAQEIGSQRDELLGYVSKNLILYYRGEYQSLVESAGSGVELSIQIGSPLFELDCLAFLGVGKAKLGDVDEGVALLQRSAEMSEIHGPVYAGPMNLGLFAMVTPKTEDKLECLDRGEDMLNEFSCLSHNYLHFYQSAIEVAYQLGDKERLNRYLEAWKQYIAAESVAWCSLYIERAELLLRLLEDPVDETVKQHLERIEQQLISAKIEV